LSGEEVARTASHLASLQVRDGQIPWFPGGHCDPWNHVEAAMALTVTGYLDEAKAAYRWLAEHQLGDGSWFNYYVGNAVKDARLDTNVCAYVAAGNTTTAPLPGRWTHWGAASPTHCSLARHRSFTRCDAPSRSPNA
jgi:hypothetical protein